MTTVSRTKRIADILTPEQSAAALDISIATLWRWVKAGTLVPKRVFGRTVFLKSNVEAVANRRRQLAAG
jgi:predicted site-specific integrase-resolvase